MGEIMKIPFLILIGSVLIVTIIFAILIWRQSIKFEKKAQVAKQRLDDYIKTNELEDKREVKR